MHQESREIIVQSDDDAWTLLKAWLDGTEIPDVTFESWPILSIKIRGGDYRSSLNSGQMSALVEMKMAMGRTYALIAHGAYDMRRLRSHEEEQIQFSTQVKRGSSILDTDLSPLIQAFSVAVTEHQQLAIIAAAIIGLALVSKPVILSYFKNRAKDLDARERSQLLDLALGRDDVKKYAVFERAVSQFQGVYPQFAHALPDARESFWKLAAASVDAEKIDIAGLELSHDELALLAERRNKRDRHVNEVVGRFRVSSVRKFGSAYRVGLESPKLSINATYQKPQLSDARIKRLFSHITNDTEIEATLQVKTIDQAQASGRLLSFKPVD